MRRLADRYALAFQQAVREIPLSYYGEASAALFQDLDGFYELLREAWDKNDLRRFVALASVAQRNKALRPKYARNLVSALTKLGQWRRAMDLLQRPQLAEESPWRYRALGSVYAASGRLDKSIAALEVAQNLEPEDSTAKRLELITETIALERGASTLDWPSVRRLFDNLIALGLHGRAVENLKRFVLDDARRVGAQRLELLQLMRTAIDLVEPRMAMDMLLLLYRICPGEYERRLLDSAQAVLLADGPAKWFRHPRPKDDEASAVLICIASACCAVERPDIASHILGRLTTDRPRDVDTRRALTQSVGAKILQQWPVGMKHRPRKQIFDLFPYNGEKMILSLKIKEMFDWVDKFIIVECRQTFTGAAKPLYFLQDEALFSRWKEKIVYVTLDAFPGYISTPWAREFYQRDYAVRGLSDLCAEDDLIMISDADEIADGSVVQIFEGEYASLRMDTFRYFLNCRRIATPQDQPRTGFLVRARYLRHFGLSYLRVGMGDLFKRDCLFNAGWHFSCINDAAGVAAKMKNSAHQEYSHFDEAHFSKEMLSARAGTLPGWEICSSDANFPDAIRRNREKLAGYFA